MIYEIVNPSDAMTIEASDERVAQAAALMLGEGKVGLHDASGERVLPLFLFGGSGSWLAEHFPGGLDVFIEAHRESIAACLESIVYCNIAQRAAIVAAVGAEAGPAALARFNDAKRSSMSNWGAYAHRLAAHLRSAGGA